MNALDLGRCSPCPDLGPCLKRAGELADEATDTALRAIDPEQQQTDFEAYCLAMITDEPGALMQTPDGDPVETFEEFVAAHHEAALANVAWRDQGVTMRAEYAKRMTKNCEGPVVMSTVRGDRVWATILCGSPEIPDHEGRQESTYVIRGPNIISPNS